MTPYEVRAEAAQGTRIPRLVERLGDRTRTFEARRSDLDALLLVEREFPSIGALEHLIQFALEQEPNGDECALAGTLGGRLARSAEPSFGRALEAIVAGAPEATRQTVALALATAAREGQIQQVSVMELATRMARSDPSQRVREALSTLDTSTMVPR